MKICFDNVLINMTNVLMIRKENFICHVVVNLIGFFTDICKGYFSFNVSNTLIKIIEKYGMAQK
jgi:hypothetical protein